VQYDDGSVAPYAENINHTADIRLNWNTTDRWQQTFSLDSALDDSESHDAWPAEITTRTQAFTWQNDVQIGDEGILTLGAEELEVKAEIKGSYDEETKNSAIFAQYQLSVAGIDLNLGLRSDDNSRYGTQTTEHLSIGKVVGNGRVFASYGTAFKAPSFNQLFYPGYGDPNLKPEESSSIELGYRQGGLQLSLFDTRIEQLIVSNPTPPWLATNIEEARIQGMEMGYTLNFGEWHLNTGLTLQDPQNETNNEQLLRRAKEKLFINLSGTVGQKSRIGVELSHTGTREDVVGWPPARIELDAYTLLNLTGSLQLSEECNLNARIENLLDEEYELVSGYGTAGRSAYISLQYKP